MYELLPQRKRKPFTHLLTPVNEVNSKLTVWLITAIIFFDQFKQQVTSFVSQLLQVGINIAKQLFIKEMFIDFFIYVAKYIGFKGGFTP